jgi:hypothetical protein
MAEVEPGNKLWPYHTHHANEEWVIVLRGEPTLRTPEGERTLAEAFFDDRPESVEYLETGKVWATSGEGTIMFARLGSPVEYWEGEE